ncbi:transglutaminase [Geomonas limicola]|uniref:Transglutaminase n=1 Tax=Geomonas limicola TaxID=2740186 RepID=A0A6V8ND13_9BACT|nr:transglutaminase family protein [Geomonas limicola]GFO70310.1 transglutaminase [Geomonas limicola]
MRYLIEHETALEYPAAVREHHVELRLAPRENRHQTLLSCEIQTDPAAELASYRDYFGNLVHYFSVIPPHTRLVTRLRAVVETCKENPLDFLPAPAAEQRQWLKSELSREPRLNDFVLHRSDAVPAVGKLAELLPVPLPEFDEKETVQDNLLGLMAWLPRVLEYRTGATVVHGALTDALRQRGGVCQDFAHLFISVARSWGIPARYVVGYLDPGIHAAGEQLATHAWAEALVPGCGWLGFDSTNALLVNDRYIEVCVGRDSHDAAPQRGSFKGESSGNQPTVKVSVLDQTQEQ